MNLLPFLKLELLGQATRENMSNASWLYFVYKRWPPTCRMEHLPFLSHFSGLSLKDSRIRSLVLTPHLFDTLTLRQRRRAPSHDTPQSHSHQARRDAHATFFRARRKTHATTIKLQGLHQRFILFSTFPLSFFYPLSSCFLFCCSVADDQWPSPVLNFRSSTVVTETGVLVFRSVSSTSVKASLVHSYFIVWGWLLGFQPHIFILFASNTLFCCSVADDQWPSPILNFRSSTAGLECDLRVCSFGLAISAHSSS